MKRAMLVTLLVGAVYWLTREVETPWLEHLSQAQAWLGGHWYIDPRTADEQVVWQGHRYTLHPPMVSVIMLTASLLHFPYETKVCVLLGAISVGLADYLLGNLWLTMFFAFGTDFWWAATNGGPWLMTEIAGCFFTFLALIMVKKNRPLVAGLCAGAAFLSRYELVFALPLYALMLSGWLPPLSSTSSTLTKSSAAGLTLPSSSGSRLTATG